MGVFRGRPFHYERTETKGYRLLFEASHWCYWQRGPESVWQIMD